jgi:diguanylate cyclase (GGDEF)-like protein/PAS domain S-box-containing protein
VVVRRNPGLLERGLESLSVGLVISDATLPDTPIVYANVAFEELTGYDRSEAIGRNASFVRGPDSDPAAIEELRAAVREQRHTRVTILNYRKDGTPFWNEVSLSPLFDASGRLAHWIELQTDVSEREVAVQGLRDAEERYRRLTENLPGIVTYIAEYDGDRLRLTYLSPQVERIFGYPRESWVGERPVWLDALHPDDRARVLEHERRRFEHGDPFDLEYRLLASDGRVVWVWDRDTVTSRDDGAARRHEGMLVDITASKNAEAALLRGQELHRSVIDALTEGVMVIQPGGTIASANPSAGRILGLDPAAGDAAATWDRFEPLTDDGRDLSIYDVGARVMETGEPARDVIMRFRRPGDDLRWVSLNLERVTRTDQPGTRELVVSFRDITARREMVDELRRSDERLRTVVGNAPLILWALDAEARITLSEGRGLAARGILPGETVGQSAYDLYAGQPEVCEDIRCALEGQERTGVADFGSVVLETHMTPLRDPDGAVAGVLGVSIDVTERERAEQRLSHMALHDSLTGLPNRSLFLDRLAHALTRGRREKTRCAVLFIDLDRFKRINDSLGHRAGDQILLESADRIAHALRADDTVARLGGDEFTVLCEGVADEAHALRVADKVSEELGHLYELDDGELYITASVGVALSDASSSPEQLLRDADAAMYRAKSRGRARTELFDEESRSHTVNRLALESALHGAVERDEFRLLYQPKVSLASERVVGFEALLRWQHPTRGLLAPEEFIAVAEDSGLIVPIGEWVLNEAARQTARWCKDRGDDPFVMCVNLSARQFAQPDIVELVRRAIETSGVDPTVLCLEITESVLMEQTPVTAATLDHLKGLGVRLAIDDFGTGYSSLGYLQRFRLDYLKVDRSFVDGLGRDPGQSAIVDAIVRLAQALGLGVIAEGVETTEQLEALRALGCDLVQGYLFAHPEPPEVAGPMLDEPALVVIN